MILILDTDSHEYVMRGYILRHACVSVRSSPAYRILCQCVTDRHSDTRYSDTVTCAVVIVYYKPPEY